MRTLPFIFTLLKFCGIWHPSGWSSGWRKNVYWLYTAFVIGTMYVFCISETVHAFQCEDLEEMANCLFMPLSTACSVCKAGNIINRRRDIIKYINILKNDNCRPIGVEEDLILEKYDKQIKQTILWYLAMVGTSVGTLTAGSFFIDVPRKTLPFNAWIPFNYTTPLCFWSAYLHQIFAHGYGAAVGTVYDILLCALISQACGQLKILQFRFQFMTRTIADQIIADENKFNHEDDKQKVESKILAKHINQHLDIYQFASSVNDAFSIVIFMQCAVSTFVLCISIYTLSRLDEISTKFIFIVVYTTCMLIQIFVYCWFGNEIMLEVRDKAWNTINNGPHHTEIYGECDWMIALECNNTARKKLKQSAKNISTIFCAMWESKDVGNLVYAMDFTELDVRTQKMLTIIMMRCLQPMKFTSGNMILLCLDTFISLLKLSYSALNLLQQTSDG